MILTRLVKRLSSAFVCLSVWLKIIKLPFWLHVKAEHMAGVTLYGIRAKFLAGFDRVTFAFSNFCILC